MHSLLSKVQCLKIYYFSAVSLSVSVLIVTHLPILSSSANDLYVFDYEVALRASP